MPLDGGEVTAWYRHAGLAGTENIVAQHILAEQRGGKHQRREGDSAPEPLTGGRSWSEHRSNRLRGDQPAARRAASEERIMTSSPIFSGVR